MGQVRHPRESTARHYALKEKAGSRGWPAESVRIWDGDWGLSGAAATRREDCKTLVAEVALRKGGAVLALAASRLSRSNTDWHRLLELWALTGTLMSDAEGCDDPAEFNDQLLLALQGTISQAEWPLLRARRQGGKGNKARKGELRPPLPGGYVSAELGRSGLDPNEEVRGALATVLRTFPETGTA